MKPGAKTSSTAASSKGPSDAAVAVTDELRSIDTAPLERLLEIRKEEARLEEYRTRAEQMKDKVKDVVWRRVVNDYARRVAELEEQASPLRTQVRVEYQKLRALSDRTRGLNDAAEIEKSELEFRHAVGELTQKQLDDRLRGPVEILEHCQADLAAIDEQRARFLSAFSSEAELEQPAEPAARAASGKTDPARPATRPAAPKPEDEPGVTVLAPGPLAKGRPPEDEGEPAPTRKFTTPPAPTPSGAVIEPDVTSIVSAEQLAAMSEAAKADAPAADGTDERTFMLPVAGLLINSDTPSPSEYRLAAMNYLGRAEDSHVMIARPGVSRKHALIVAGTGGFSIKDLASQNGTFVNGQRITEQPLNDGDQIVIGDTKLVFRTPWPATGPGART